MDRQLCFLIAVPLFCVACEPGSGTISGSDTAVSEDAAQTDDVAAASDTPSTQDTRQPDAAEDRDTAGDVSGRDMTGSPSPARFFTAETDGTIGWGTHDPSSDTLALDDTVERGGRIAFLAFSDDGQRLFATNETRVEAFDIADGSAPEFIGAGDATINGTHLEVDHTGQWVFVASYGGNAVSMLPIDSDGTPGDATVVLGGDDDPDFCQNAHQVRVHPDNEHVYVPCLGSDHVAVLAFDSAAGTLQALTPAPTPAGSGPRHMDFHPTRSLAYVIGEQDDTVTIFDVGAETGALTQLDVVSTRPTPSDPLGPASDIHVSPDGEFVIGINRNPRNELVVFRVDGDTLTEVDRESTSGEHARTFAFAPGGRRLLVGNSNSMDVALFDLSDEGQLSYRSSLRDFDARLFYVGFPR